MKKKFTNKRNNKVESFFMELKKVLESTQDFVACYLAGSYVYGYYMDEVSDLDITIIFGVNNFDKQKKHKVQMLNILCICILTFHVGTLMDMLYIK